MPAKSFAFLAIAVAVLPFVSAHGDVYSVSANGKTVKALNPYYPVGSSAVRVMNKNELPEAFIEPPQWTDNSKFSCENAGNKPAKEHLTVTAGSSVTVSWRGATDELVHQAGTGNTGERKPWVHATGPILDYLTDCKGDCTKFDATNAGWTKIQAMGIDMGASISDALRNTMKHKGGVGEPYYPLGKGLWAAAKMIQENSNWNVQIPKELKSGKYLLRHEVSSMHSAGKNQNYIACIQLDVVSGGSAALPSGTQAKDLYSPNGAFAKFSIYNDKPESFQVPGPALWDRSSSGTPAPPAEPKPEEPKPADPKPADPKPSNPKPTDPQPPAVQPETPKPSTPKPETPKPETPKPSTPTDGKPSTQPPTEAKPPVKCRQRKRAIPVATHTKRSHRKRLGVEH